MFRTLAVPAFLALGLAACGTSGPMASSSPMTPPGEGPAFGASGGSQAPVTATTGASGTRGMTATSRASAGSSPMDDSNSASARGNPMANNAPSSRAGIGATPTDDSNSASARGGPGTGPVAGRDTRNASLSPDAPQVANRRMTPAQRRAAARQRPAATGSDAAYMGGGTMTETPVR